MYELVNVLGDWVITRTDEDGLIWCIPSNPANSDYQKYLVDTDGGLPLPKETKEDK
jgi:hypothetical protein